MILEQKARAALRDATSEWHRRVDAIFSTADLANRTNYGRFLCAQAAAHLPAENALDAGGAQNVMDDWASRRRAGQILADLDALGLTLPTLEPEPILTGAPAIFGATYVLEGSRLGGAMLSHSIPDNFPRAFLAGGSSTSWRRLISLLDATLTTGEKIEAAIAAACDTFALFERSGRRLLVGDILAS